MKIKLSIILLLFVSLMACKKDITIADVDFDANLTNARATEGNTLVFKLGDTCKFALTGTAQNITFYSGEAGKNYDYRNRTEASGPISLSFTSTAQFGTQTNTLKVYAIKNLPKRDSVTVVSANWIDITSRANLATSATAVASGNIDLSDIITNSSDSLFIAFKYDGVTGSTQRTWTITNYTVNKALPNLTYNLASLSADASFWTRYGNVWNPANGRWIATSTQLQVVGGAATAATNSTWIVSKSIYANRVAADVPAVIKSIAGAFPKTYGVKYPTVGTYRAVFVGFNNSVDAQDEIVKTFNIKIIP